MERLSAWGRRHPDLAEYSSGAAGALAVLLVSLAQWGLTPDGWARGLTLGTLCGAAIAITYRRRRRAAERREQARLQQRLQLARELHDAVAGQVAIIGIQASAARRVLATRPDDAALALEHIEDASRTAVADLRRMLDALREGAEGPSAVPSASPEPGLGDIDGLVQHAGEAGLDVRLTVRGDRGEHVPAAVDHAAYRIAQESITNVLKHSGANRATIDLSYEPAAIALRIENESGTSHPGRAAGGIGLGLTGMRERARFFGGSVSAGPSVGGGWLVEARLPFDEDRS
jgi:signal transduction histidine kinase